MNESTSVNQHSLSHSWNRGRSPSGRSVGVILPEARPSRTGLLAWVRWAGTAAPLQESSSSEEANLCFFRRYKLGGNVSCWYAGGLEGVCNSSPLSCISSFSWLSKGDTTQLRRYHIDQRKKNKTENTQQFRDIYFNSRKGSSTERGRES